MRCFLPRAVPVATAGPSAPHAEALGTAAERLGAHLEGGALQRWPTKQKLQLWAALWLALHLVPDRVYRQAEVPERNWGKGIAESASLDECELHREK